MAKKGNKTNKKTNEIKSKVQLNEKLDIVENPVEISVTTSEEEELEKDVNDIFEQNEDISFDEIEKAVKEIDVTIDDIEPESEETDEETNVQEVEDVIEQIENIQKSEEEFKENFEKVETQEEAEELIKQEIEKTEKAKEKARKIIRNYGRSTTSSWNGMYYG
jgi:hypothetical protein